MKKILVVTSFILIIIIGYFFSANRSQETTTNKEISERYVTAEGKLEAIPGFEVEIGSELTGRIAMFNAKEGTEVKKGETIAIIDNSDLIYKIKEAEAGLKIAQTKLKDVKSGSRKEEIRKATAALEGSIEEMDLAKKELTRYTDLYKDGIISKADLDEKEMKHKVTTSKVKEAEEEKNLLEQGTKEETIKVYEDSVKQAKSTVEYYKKFLEKTIVTTPISGKVIHKYLQEGEIVMPEKPIAIIADLDKVQINAEIDETDIGRVHIGDQVEITSYTYPGRIIKGKVREIADYVGIRKVKPNNPATNLGMKVIQVKIEMQEKVPLQLGMSVDIKIIPQSGNGNVR